ncbi:MAG: hypothetical protein ABI818_06615 [Acidobacteriota bacterium]
MKKLSAGLLVVLVLLASTAPFQTCDLGELAAAGGVIDYTAVGTTLPALPTTRLAAPFGEICHMLGGALAGKAAAHSGDS